MDLKAFVNTDDDVRLARKSKGSVRLSIVLRDVEERGRSVLSVLIKYNKQAKPGFQDFIKPTERFADIIIPYGQRNNVAIEFIVANVKNRLRKMHKATRLAKEAKVSRDSLTTIPTQSLPDPSVPLPLKDASSACVGPRSETRSAQRLT